MLTVEVRGQSFLLNQIRKMIGTSPVSQGMPPTSPSLQAVFTFLVASIVFHKLMEFGCCFTLCFVFCPPRNIISMSLPASKVSCCLQAGPFEALFPGGCTWAGG